MKVIENIQYGVDKDQVLNVYLPQSKEFDLFVYFHGGGLTEGNQRDINMSAPQLLENNIAIVSATYRKYPEAKYPDFIDDAALAVKWAIDNIKSYGELKRIFVGGASAGAYLTMMLCFDKSYLEKYGVSVMDIGGFVFIAGQPTTHFNVLKERGIDSKRLIVDKAAPLYHIGTESDYPGMLFIVSDKDMPARYEQTMLTIATLKHFGYDFPKVQLKVMENTLHCTYVNDKDRNPEFVGSMCDFFSSI